MTDRSNIIVELESRQDGELASHTYKGEWFRKERSIYIRYIEEENGAEEIRTLIRFRPEELSITRRGVVHSEQIFAPGQVRAGSYRTPYMSMQLETHTSGLSMVEPHGSKPAVQNGDGLPDKLPFSLEWSYELYTNEQQSGEFHIKLHIREDV